MTVATSKYRGTIDYFLVHAELTTAARYRGTLTYVEIADIMGLPATGSYMGSQTGQMVGEISEDEHSSDRPLLSALVVSSTNGLPGPGFFIMAQRLGKLSTDASDDEKHRYWETERADVYATWRRTRPKTRK